MVNSIRSLNADSEPHGCTFQNAARRWDTSVHTLKRAESYGMIATIKFGDRSIIPPAEVARIDREGVGPIPAGYKRKTSGHWPGRQRSVTTAAKTKAKTPKAASKAPPRRPKRGEERSGAT
jgi:hypothetical protein